MKHLRNVVRGSRSVARAPHIGVCVMCVRNDLAFVHTITSYVSTTYTNVCNVCNVCSHFQVV